MTDPTSLERGAAHHRAGRFHEAEIIYRQILSADPNQPDALHLLGMLAQEAKQPAEAIRLIGRAIELRRNEPAYHNSLGLIHASVGDHPSAEACFHRAVVLRPDFAEAHHNLGAALAGSGRWREAADAFREAVKLRPDFAHAREGLKAAENKLGGPANMVETRNIPRRRFCQSPLWRLQTENYRKAGPAAWTRAEAVPSFASSSAPLARIYASLIEAFWRSLSAADRPETLRILEPGAGLGRFAFLLIQELQSRIDEHGQAIPLEYVLADISEETIAYWRANPRLGPLEKSGVVRFERDAGPLTLASLNEQPPRPTVLIANYFFDSITQDLFRVVDGRLEQGLSVADESIESSTPLAERFGNVAFEPLSSAASAFPDNAHLAAVLKHYRSSPMPVQFLFPLGAMDVIERVHHASGGRLLVLAGDKGYCTIEELANAKDSPIAAGHGDVASFSLNFHALKQFADKLGGSAILPSDSASMFVVGAFAFGLDSAGLSRLRRVYCDTVEASPPWALLSLIASHLPKDADLTYFLSLVRLCQFDPEVVARVGDHFAALAESASAAVGKSLEAAMQEVWKRFYPTGHENGRLGRTIAHLLHAAGLTEAAINILDQALELEDGPASAKSLFNLAVCHRSLQHWAKAAEYLTEAAKRDPSDVQTRELWAQTNVLAEAQRDGKSSLPDWIANGDDHRGGGRWGEAAVCYQQALALRADLPEVASNLGLVLHEQGRLAEAKAAFEHALKYRPQFAEVYDRLGNLHQDAGDHEAAKSSYQTAISADPRLVHAQVNLAQLLANEGRVDESENMFRDALRLASLPKARVAAEVILPPIYSSQEELLRRREKLIANVEKLHRDRVTVDPRVEIVPNLFYLAYQGFNDREVMKRFSAVYAPKDEKKAPRRGKRSGKIRLGMISKFFCNHTIGNLNQGLVAKLSRDDFEVTVISAATADDQTSRHFRAHADRFVPLPQHPPSARKIVDELDLDVLFYPDLGMSPFTFSLAFSRLAPVQCVSWGHPLTTGIPVMDYFLSDELLEVPEADSHYTEKLVRLRGLQSYYYRPTTDGATQDRSSLGLPEGMHLYGCPQTLFKFHPEFDEILAGILRRDPKGILVLLEGKYPYWNELLLRRWRRFMPDVLERVRFLPPLPRPDFIQLNSIVDVLLDPLHFGGGNTTFEALSVGAPVVTLPSQFLRARITQAIYRRMGLLDFIVQTPSEYIDLAVRLGADKGERAAAGRKILESAGSLFEDATAVRSFEEFFHKAAGR